MKQDNISIICCYEEETWNAEITNYHNYGTYCKANITGRGSSLDILIGETIEYKWIALPIVQVSATLAHLDDIFWNKEQLSSLIGIIDATSVANALPYIKYLQDTITFDNNKKTKTKTFKYIALSVFLI